jgi:hypothetical protein
MALAYVVKPVPMFRAKIMHFPLRPLATALKYAVLVPLERPLDSTPVSPVFLFHAHNLEKLVLEVVSLSPFFFLKASGVRSHV